MIGLGFLGALAASPLWILLLVYWGVRDWPRRGRGFNVTDRMACVRRWRKPSHQARAASLRRAAPLFAAFVASFFVPLAAAFGGLLLVDLFGLAFGDDAQLIGDKLAGTRGRLLR